MSGYFLGRFCQVLTGLVFLILLLPFSALKDIRLVFCLWVLLGGFGGLGVVFGSLLLIADVGALMRLRVLFS